MLESDLKEKTSGMTNSDLISFVLENDRTGWTTACVYRLERIISLRLDRGGDPGSRKYLSFVQKQLKKELLNRRPAPELPVQQEVSEKKVISLIKQGLKSEEIAKECRCTVNYVVCTKRERLGKSAVEDETCAEVS